LQLEIAICQFAISQLQTLTLANPAPKVMIRLRGLSRFAREVLAMPTTRLWRFLPVLSIVLFLGCGENSQAPVPIRGKVTYRGQPVQNGTIVFTPDPRKGQVGAMAIGEIQPDGTYSLRNGKAFGAPPGYYRITVAAVLGSPYSTQTSLPDKYRDPELSGLVYEIKAGLAQTVDLKLD
jgi:hypothetical protein